MAAASVVLYPSFELHHFHICSDANSTKISQVWWFPIYLGFRWSWCASGLNTRAFVVFYIWNDLPAVADHAQVNMYAELHYCDDLQRVQNDLQSDLYLVQGWLQANRLQLNVSNSVIMLLDPGREHEFDIVITQDQGRSLRSSIITMISMSAFDITGLYPTTFDHKQIIRLSYCL